MRFLALATLIPAIFLAQCAFLIPMLGVQADEVLFASAIYEPIEYTAALGGFPLMLDSYLGCLKAWLYQPILAVFGPGIYSLRIPAVLLGAMVILILMRLLDGPAGGFAATLLATDTTYVLTTTFDWGPVALQHFFLAGVMLLARSQQPLWMAGAGFLAGLGIWDKASFLWLIAGLAAGAAAAWPKAFKVKPASLFLAGLLLGASPFLYATALAPAGLAETGGGISSEGMDYKIERLRRTLDGSALEGFFLRPETGLAGAFGSWMTWAVAAGFAAGPLLWRTPLRRPWLFTVVALVVSLALMLFTRKGGAGSHHIVLVWPLPQMLVAIAATRLWNWKRLPAVLGLATLCLSALATTFVYIEGMESHGTVANWSHATEDLTRMLEQRKPETILPLDWGLTEQLRFFSAGRLRVSREPYALWNQQWGVGERQLALRLAGSASNLFVARAPGEQMIPGVKERLVEAVASVPLRPVRDALIADRKGRFAIEVFHFER